MAGGAMLVINDRIAIPIEEFQFAFARSGGPGGQNVNKVASKVTLRWLPGASPSLPADVRDRLLRAVAPRLTTAGELLVRSQRTRDQGLNVQDCLEKVRQLVQAAAVPPRPRRPTRPTAASVRRRRQAKAQRSAAKRLRRAPETD